jgi:hypothetical protein
MEEVSMSISADDTSNVTQLPPFPTDHDWTLEEWAAWDEVVRVNPECRTSIAADSPQRLDPFP